MNRQADHVAPITQGAGARRYGDKTIGVMGLLSSRKETDNFSEAAHALAGKKVVQILILWEPDDRQGDRIWTKHSDRISKRI